MPDVLEADGIPTPVDDSPADDPNELRCNECGATTNSRGKKFNRQTLGTHKYLVHKIRATGASPSDPPKGGSNRVRGGAGGNDRSDPPPPPGKPLASRLEGSIGLIGLGVGFVEPYDGKCIQQGAKGVAKALDELCDQYPDIRKYVEMLCFDSPALAVVLALLPIILPILKHHGIIPDGLPLPGPYAGPPDPGRPAPDGNGSAPAGAPPIDLAAILQSGLFVDLARQASTAAARPMGEGAPDEPEQYPSARRAVTIPDDAPEPEPELA